MSSKDYLRIDAAIDNQLRNANKQKDYAEAKRLNLFSLGEELFNNGYDYDEFMANLIICFLAPKEKADDVCKEIHSKYLDIKSFPDLNTIIKVATNMNYVQTIRNGYNRAKRLNDFLLDKVSRKK